MGGQFYHDSGPASQQPWRLWPGESKPGIWMSTMSKMGQLVKTCHDATPRDESKRNDEIFNIPPVFNNCSVLINPEQEVRARDLYWEVMLEGGAPSSMNNASTDILKCETLLNKLKQSIELNPFIAEPHVVSAQLYSDLGDFDNALMSAESGLKLFCEWGTCWDKRMGWPAWIAWTRVLAQRAEQKQQWPKDTWGVMNLGLVHQN